MMLLELINSCGILLLEMLFVFVSLALLHSQRRFLGSAAFCMVLGMLFVFAQIIAAADLQVQLGENLTFRFGPSVLFPPLLAAFLMIYITDGTLAAQYIIVGMLAVYGVFLYLAQMTQLEYSWGGLKAADPVVGAVLSELLSASVRSMLLLLAVNILNLFLLPITYTKLLHLRCRRFFAIFVAFGCVQLIDLAGWSLIQSAPMATLHSEIAIRLGVTLVICFLLTVYLSKIESESLTVRRSALDIFFAFFGSYGHAQKLEAKLRDQETRHRLILDNSTDAMIMLTPDGIVIDQNVAATRLLNHSLPKFSSTESLFNMLKSDNGEPTFNTIPCAGENAPVLRFSARLGDCYLDCSLSPISFMEERLFLLIGRDNTESYKLHREKELLSAELAHSQRLEALGKLAGGIAHDFNNNLHAILGHVDLAMMSPSITDPDTVRHLNKVAEIAEQSASLTRQLLGFARKGKFIETKLNLCDVVTEGLGLLPPIKQKYIDVRLDLPKEPLTVCGDIMQLKQVFLNLLLNAIDAMKNNTGECILEISGGDASAAPVEMRPPPSIVAKSAKHYVFIMIKDNGAGIADANVQRIFEPFFTTKPVGQGTGMGLPMVYGTITNHHGFIQVESKVDCGSAFYVFLPRK